MMDLLLMSVMPLMNAVSIIQGICNIFRLTVKLLIVHVATTALLPTMNSKQGLYAHTSFLIVAAENNAISFLVFFFVDYKQ